MSSRSGATVRTKRTTTPAEYARPQTGPVTSVHSQQIFNSGANTTGVNARINGTSGATTKNVSTPPSQQQYVQQPTELYNPPPGSKLTIGNAVALITLRLGRLETFMNQYQLEEPRNGNDLNNEIMQSVLTRITALEQKSSTVHSVGLTNSSKNATSSTSTSTSNGSSNSTVTVADQSVLNRVTALEKHSETHHSNIKVMSDGLRSIETSLREISKTEVEPNAITDYVSEVKSELGFIREEFHTFAEELKETKDLLLKLQSFTMETNTKLVNTIFSQVDQFNIQEYQNEMDEFVCDDTFDEDVQEFGSNEVEELGEDEESVVEDANEIKSGGITVNFKELISRELLGISS